MNLKMHYLSREIQCHRNQRQKMYMEEIKNYQDSKEEGKKVWAALNSQVGEGVGFFSAFFMSIVSFLKKHLLFLLIFGVAGGALGCIYAATKKRIVKAEMTVSYAQLEKKIYADMLFKVEELLTSKQYAVLSKLLGLPEEQVKKIRKIDSKNINNEPLVKDISTQKVPFYIVVEVYDESILPDLQNALVKYINEPPFVKSRLKLNEQNYQNELTLLHKQLEYMDSLKVILLRNLKDPDEGAVAIASLNNLNKGQNEIFARIRDLQGALQFNQNIEVMDGFVGHRLPLKQLFLPYLLIGMAIGIGFRLIWITFR
jgi:hypothetical protein